MSLLWDDDEEDLTEIEYRRRPPRPVVHDEPTVPLAAPVIRPEDRAALPVAEPVARPLGLRPALTRDRFVAFLIDSYLGFFIYWLSGALLARGFKTASLPELHANPGRFWIHLAITLLAFFFYYLLMESVLHATLGKLFTRLRVVEVGGLAPSLGSIFIRNFLRFIDYPLFFLIAVISIESSPLNQRLGDRAANTVVIKKARTPKPAVDLLHTPLASTLSRLLAEVVDLLLVGTLLYGLLLFIRPNHLLATALIYLLIPPAYLAYYTVTEFLMETSPGKALFGRRVVLENGEAPDGTSAALRNLFRPLDYILGYPLLVISKRKQRLGDMAADTLVVARAAGAKALWGSLAAFVVVGIIFYLGARSPESLFKKTFGLNPIPTFRAMIPHLSKVSPSPGNLLPSNGQLKKPKTALPASTSAALKLDEFYLATGPEPTQIRHDQTFRQGDLIFLFFKLDGVSADSKQEARLTEDLKVEDPQGNLILEKPEIVKITKQISDPKQAILFANNIQLPKEAPKGTYRVLITVHDLVADKQFAFEKNFILQ